MPCSILCVVGLASKTKAQGVYHFMNQIGNMKQEETTTKDVPFYEANFVLWLCILCVFALLYKMFHALLFRLFDSVLTMFGSKTDTQSMDHFMVQRRQSRQFGTLYEATRKTKDGPFYEANLVFWCYFVFSCCFMQCPTHFRHVMRRTNLCSLSEMLLRQGRLLLVDLHCTCSCCTSSCARSSCCCSTDRSSRWSGNQSNSIFHGKRSSRYGTLRTASRRLPSRCCPHATPSNNRKSVKSACSSTCTPCTPKHL